MQRTLNHNQPGYSVRLSICFLTSIALILSNPNRLFGQQKTACDSAEAKAGQLLNQESYKEAIPYFVKAENCTTNTQLSFFLGRCYLQTGKYRQAINAFNRFNKRNQPYFWSYGNRARCYNGLGKTDSALADFRMAISLYKKFKAGGRTSKDGYFLYADLAGLYWRQGNNLLAENQYRLSLADYAEDPEIYLDLTEVLLAAKKFKACDSIFSKISTLNPSNANLVLFLYYQHCADLLGKRPAQKSEMALKASLQHSYHLEWNFDGFNKAMSAPWVPVAVKQQIRHYEQLIIAGSDKIKTPPAKETPVIDDTLRRPVLAIQLTGSTADMGGFLPNGMQIFDHAGFYQANYNSPYADTTCSARVRFFTHNKGVITIWDAATGSEIRRLFNVGRVLTIATAATGRRIATADINGNVRVWNVETGQVLATFRGCKSEIALSADGAKVIVFQDNEMRDRDKTAFMPSGVYEVETQKLFCVLNTNGGYLEHVTFSPDGKKVLMLSDRGVADVINIEKKQSVVSILVKGAQRGFFSNDSRKLALPGDSLIVVDGEDWSKGNAFTEKIMDNPIKTLGRDDNGVVSHLFWTNENKSLLALTGDLITEWNVATGRVETTYGQGNSVSVATGKTSELRSLVFCADRNELVAGRSDGSLLEWRHSVAQPHKIISLNVPDKEWWHLLPGTRGQLLILDGIDDKLPYLFDLDSSTLSAFPRNQNAEDIKRADFADDGASLLVQSSKRLTIWDIKNTGRPVMNYEVRPDDFLIATDGTVLVDRSGNCYRAINGSLITKIKLPEKIADYAFLKKDSLLMLLDERGLATLIRLKDGAIIQHYITNNKTKSDNNEHTGKLAISADLQTVGVMDYDTLYVFNANGGLRKKFSVQLKEFSGVNLLKYLESSGSFVAGYDNGQLRIWSVENFEIQNLSNNFAKDLYTLKEDIIKIVELKKQHKLIVLSKDGLIKSFPLAKTDYPDIKFDHEPADMQLAFAADSYVVWIGSVLDCSLSNDQTTLVTAGADGTMRLWDCNTGRKKLSLNNYSPTRTIAFSHDDRYLITSCEDGSVHIWDLVHQKELSKLAYYAGNDWAVFTNDGSFDTSNPEKIAGLNWIFPDAPFTPTSPLILTRDYYKYRLLARTFAKEVSKVDENKELRTVNRVQPLIESIRVSPESSTASEWVNVTVRVNSGDYSCKSPLIKRSNGIYDVRLFRDGQLVGESPEHAADYLLQTTNTGNQEKAAWRSSSFIRSDSTVAIIFHHIRLPAQKDQKSVAFSAYAFNEDRVKGETRSVSYRPVSPLQVQSTRVVILSMGVSNVENGLNLATAANDARVLNPTVRQALSGQYGATLPISLISSDKTLSLDEVPATKENLRYILSLLSGKKGIAKGIRYPVLLCE